MYLCIAPYMCGLCIEMKARGCECRSKPFSKAGKLHDVLFCGFCGCNFREEKMGICFDV